MKVNWVLGRRLEAMTFLRDDMQQNRSVDFADHFQVLFHDANVVPVDRPKVLEAELLKHHAAVKAGFDAFFNLKQQTFGRVTQNWNLAQRFHDFIFDASVDSVGTQPIQIGCDAAHARANRHLVIVQNDQHFAVQFRCVVDCFKNDA